MKDKTNYRQLKKIWSMVGDLAEYWGKEMAQKKLREVVENVTGQRSTKNLSYLNAGKIADKLSLKLRYLRRSDGRDIISGKVQAALQQHYRDLGWDKARQIGFNKRQIGVAWPQTNVQGNKVLEGLKAMLKRRYTPEKIKDMISEIDEADNLTDWERDIFLKDMKSKIGKGITLTWVMIKKIIEIHTKRVRTA